MTQQEVFEKIKKLMALSKSANENEASLALSRAQKLMKEYQISMDDVTLSEIKEQGEMIVPAMRDRVLYTTLASIISKAFGVDYYINFTYKTPTSTQSVATKTVFIGPEQRLATACYTYTVLARQACNVKKEFSAKERVRVKKNLLRELSTLDILDVFSLISSYDTDYDGYVRKTVDREVRKNTKAYVFGWLNKVHEKVVDFAQTIEEQKLIDTYITKNHPNLTAMRRTRNNFTQAQLEAFSSGKNDAERNVHLFQGINGKENAKLGFNS